MNPIILRPRIARAARLTCSCSALLLGVLLTSATPALAGDDEREDRWTPALNTSLILFSYEAVGAFDSTVGFEAKGDNDKTVPTFQLGLDVKSPALRQLLWEPRVALFAGAQVGPRQDLTLASIGALVDGEPENALDQNPNLPDPDDYLGPGGTPIQGGELIGTYDSVGWYLGAGLSFELPTSPAIRIRPFVMYEGEQAEMKAEVARVTGTQGNYVVTRSKAKNEKIFHYLGPGIEVEADLVSGDRIGVSLYATVDVLWSVGDRTTSFRDSVIRASYKADDYKPRGGLGIRLSWLDGF